MRQFTWKEYYEGFYDWSTNTQISYSRGLTDYGASDEVFEVVQEFAFGHEQYASQFVLNAIAAGVRFSPEQVIEGSVFLQKSAVNKMAECSSRAFTREELEEIYLIVDDSVFEQLSKRAKIDIFADNDEAEMDIDDILPHDNENDIDFEESPKIGFFTALFSGMAGGREKKARHGRKCDGDCAHCPPHYGYRYGRWYYGHGHQYGCEFGGNRGDGSL